MKKSGKFLKKSDQKRLNDLIDSAQKAPVMKLRSDQPTFSETANNILDEFINTKAMESGLSNKGVGSYGIHRESFEFYIL